jgi:glycosyltransferase involved in cell wall biosynthesis
MRVLFFTENLRAGGKERRIVELLKSLKRQGNVEVELVLSKNLIHYEEIFTLNIPIHIIERKILKKDPRLFFKFFWIAKAFKPDFIHVWGHMVAVYAVPTKLLLGVPLINNEIADSTLNAKLLFKRQVFKASDRIIANSYAGLKAYDAPMTKSTVIYNGFSFDRIKNIEEPSTVRERFGIRTAHVVGMVASFLEYKDYKTYIQAALSLLKSKKDITFLCIGDGDDTNYKEMVSDEKQEANILFLGRQNNVESIMNICDIGVLTTNVNFHGEGISNALMEFMALSKPVITTNFGGSSELVEEGESGYLIEAFNALQLSGRINFLLDNRSERERLGENALQRIKTKFSMDAMLNLFLQEYKNIVKLS